MKCLLRKRKLFLPDLMQHLCFCASNAASPTGVAAALCQTWPPHGDSHQVVTWGRGGGLTCGKRGSVRRGAVRGGPAGLALTLAPVVTHLGDTHNNNGSCEHQSMMSPLPLPHTTAQHHKDCAVCCRHGPDGMFYIFFSVLPIDNVWNGEEPSK